MQGQQAVADHQQAEEAGVDWEHQREGVDWEPAELGLVGGVA